MNFAFVILHYKNTTVTKRCINSILKLYCGSKIIVVDNASCDGTGEHLEKQYRECTDVHVIKLTKTNGFSYGNNIGCSYAVSAFSPEFLVVCNSDTYFIDPNMLKKISKLYLETRFAVMGPDIMIKEKNEHQSPFRSKYMTIVETQREIGYYRKRRFLYSNIQRLHLEKSYHFIVNNVIYRFGVKLIDEHRIRLQHIKMKCSIQQKNVCLYGACLIFSDLYIKKFKNIFYPETHFYCEEDILLAKCISNGFLVLYDPSIKVLHTGKASTYLGVSSIQNELWRLDNLINSRYVYIDFLNQLKL